MSRVCQRLQFPFWLVADSRCCYVVLLRVVSLSEFFLLNGRHLNLWSSSLVDSHHAQFLAFVKTVLGLVWKSLLFMVCFRWVAVSLLDKTFLTAALLSILIAASIAEHFYSQIVLLIVSVVPGRVSLVVALHNDFWCAKITLVGGHHLATTALKLAWGTLKLRLLEKFGIICFIRSIERGYSPLPRLGAICKTLKGLVHVLSAEHGLVLIGRLPDQFVWKNPLFLWNVFTCRLLPTMVKRLTLTRVVIRCHPMQLWLETVVLSWCLQSHGWIIVDSFLTLGGW